MRKNSFKKIFLSKILAIYIYVGMKEKKIILFSYLLKVMTEKQLLTTNSVQALYNNGPILVCENVGFEGTVKAMEIRTHVYV